jgi:U3 small nucleolar RNA-associated protein 15
MLFIASWSKYINFITLAHYRPTQVTQFSTNKSNILSASDDKTVRIWDIPSGESVNVFEEHEDYVRAGVVSQDNPNLFISGSYDQTVKLWDMRQSESVMTLMVVLSFLQVDLLLKYGIY